MPDPSPNQKPILSFTDPDILALVTLLQRAAEARNATLATAESCTGGLLATFLTAHPGSSATYRGGVSAYDNSVKEALLGVDPTLLVRHGAVSAQVAEAMARGARERLGATFAVAVTGIAGPDGGTPAKPVGMVFCGLAGPGGVRHQVLSLSGDRTAIRLAAARAALEALARLVEEGK